MRTGNASAERILGLPSEELTGRSVQDERWRIIHEDGSAFLPEDYPAVITLRTGEPCASVVMGVYRPDGSCGGSTSIRGPYPPKAGSGPSAVVVSFSDITERKRAEERLTAQYAVTRVLAESRSLEDAVPKIMRAVGQNLEWDCGIFWRVDRTASLLRCLDQWRAPGVEAQTFLEKTWERTFRPEEGLPGRIWAVGKPHGSRMSSERRIFPDRGWPTRWDSRSVWISGARRRRHRRCHRILQPTGSSAR